MKFTPKRGTVMVRIALESAEKDSETPTGSRIYPIESSLSSSFRATTKPLSACESCVASCVHCCRFANNGGVAPSSSPAINGAKTVGTIRISIIDSGPGVEKVCVSFMELLATLMLTNNRRTKRNYFKSTSKLIQENYRKGKDLV